MKYRLNSKFTKLESLDVGLWAKTFQVAGHEEGPQLPNKQWLEPLKPQPPQHTSMHASMSTNELPVTEQ